MKNEPLGLPKGSVRAILVLGILIMTIVGIFVKNDPAIEHGGKLLAMLIPLYIGVQLPSGRESTGD